MQDKIVLSRCLEKVRFESNETPGSLTVFSGKTDARTYGEQLTTSIYHKLCLIWSQQEMIVKTAVTNS